MFRIKLHFAGTNRFMSILNIFSLVCINEISQIFIRIMFPNICSYRRLSFIGNADRVGTDIGHQAHRALAFNFNALVKLLRDKHCLFRMETQFIRSFLLQAARRKRRVRFFHAIPFFYFGNDKLSLLQRSKHSIGFFFFFQLYFLAAAF